MYTWTYPPISLKSTIRRKGKMLKIVNLIIDHA